MRYNSRMELCHWCFREVGTVVKYKKRGWVALSKHVDHASPRSYSHDNSKSNLVTSCNLCNLWKSNRVFDSGDQCRSYLETKWRKRIYEEVSVLPSGFQPEAELAGVLQQEMPNGQLASKPVAPVSKLRNASIVRGAREKTVQAEKESSRPKLTPEQRQPLREWRASMILRRIEMMAQLRGKGICYETRKGRLLKYDLSSPDLRRSDKLVDRKGNAYMVASYFPGISGELRRIGENLYAQKIKPPHPDAKAVIRRGKMFWILPLEINTQKD